MSFAYFVGDVCAVLKYRDNFVFRFYYVQSSHLVKLSAIRLCRIQSNRLRYLVDFTRFWTIWHIL